MRAARGILVGSIAVAMMVVVVPAHASPGGTHGAPVLVRDKQAGRDTLTPTPPEQADTTTEPSIAVNPADPKNAVTCYQVGRVDGGGDQLNGCATTFDGGKTWTQQYLPGLTPDSNPPGPWDRASDAVVAFGPNNVVYADSLVFNDGSESGDTNTSGVVNNVSTDGGKTWGMPKIVINDQLGGLNDKNWIVVDNSNASGHHKGRVYVTWDRVAPVLASYSDDQGTTWNGPFVINPGQGIGTIPLVMPNGDLAVVYDSLNPEQEDGDGVIPPIDVPTEPGVTVDKIVISLAAGAGTIPTGGALAFGPPLKVADYMGTAIRQQRAGSLPAADVDQTTGRVYVAWEDNRFRTDEVNDIVMAYSDDEGVTWSNVIRVTLGPGDNWIDHYNAMIAVGPNGGVRVGGLQRQEAPATSGFSRFVDTVIKETFDGGAHFSKPVKVNVQKSDVDFAAFSRNGAFFGDYNQIAVGGDLTYVARCQAHSQSPGEPATFPPSVHHQRTWVAVLKET